MSVSPFDPRVLPVAALLLFRVGAVVLVAPMFSGRSIPMAWRTALTLVLVLLLLPAALTDAGVPRITPAAVAGELLVGFGIGFAAALLVGAAEAAGDIIAIQTGLSAASTLDPLSSMNVPVLGQLLSLTVILLLLLSGGHVAMIGALADSTAVLPVGADVAFTTALGELLRQGGIIMALGLRFAAPVILVVFLTNAALGVLARTAPQLNVFVLAYPLQIGLGLLTFAVALPFTLRLVGGWTGEYSSMVERFLGTVTP